MGRSTSASVTVTVTVRLISATQPWLLETSIVNAERSRVRRGEFLAGFSLQGGIGVTVAMQEGKGKGKRGFV